MPSLVVRRYSDQPVHCRHACKCNPGLMANHSRAKRQELPFYTSSITASKDSVEDTLLRPTGTMRILKGHAQ